MIRRFIRRALQQPRGQALVEFALVLPVLILLLVGIFDFGRAVYAFNTVNNAAREAVRLAIVDQNCNRIGQAAKQHASSLNVAWTYDGSLSKGAGCYANAQEVHIQFLEVDYSGDDSAAPQDFNDSCDPDQPIGPTTGTRIGCIAEVTVTYQYTAATPIIGNLIGTLTLEGKAQEPIERG
ncbi:MAG TPA: TadE family protein, partial [Candidatus Limnocylindria bacterium]